MGEWLKNLFVAIFGEHSGIATFIISMIPIVELRGAIPFGAADAMWGANALPVWLSFLISVAGSSLVCVILTFLFMPFFNWLKRTKLFKKIASAIENKISKNSEKIEENAKKEKNEKRKKLIMWLGVFLFVAIPLPLTGVWTGTAIALFIGMSRKATMTSVISGNLVAGLIMMAVSYLFADNTIIVLWIFLALLAVFILAAVIKKFIDKIRNKNKPIEIEGEVVNEPQQQIEESK
ncbi:MAG: small multi-drug export protein [Clostridia bacterium]|nr:small multi-drug export protein [Clostridia bacterium]